MGGENIVFRPRDFIIVAGTGNVKSTLVSAGTQGGSIEGGSRGTQEGSKGYRAQVF